MSVRAKIIALVAAGVILPVLLVSVVVISSFRTDAVEKFSDQSKAEIGYVDALFSLYLKNLAESVVFFAKSEAIESLSKGSLTSFAEDPSMKMKPGAASEAEREAYRLMEGFGDAHPNLAYVWAGLEDSGYIQWPLKEAGSLYDPTQRPWYKAAQGKVGPVRIPAYLDAFSGAPVVDYVHTFRGKDGVKGVVGMDVTLKELTETLKAVKFGGEGYVVMVEDTGVVLADPAAPDNNFKSIDKASRPYASLSSSEDIQTLVIDGEEWFAHVYVSKELNWKFIGLIPSRVVYGQVNDLIADIAIISVIMIVIFVVIGSLLSAVVIKPIKLMAERLEGISSGEGDLTQRLDDSSNDESGKMARAFNQFVESIDDIVGRTKRSCEEISGLANKSDGLSNGLNGVVTKQANSVDHLSSAFNEMVATANEVASNCTSAASAAESSEQQVQEGNRLIQQTMDSLNSLEREIMSSNESMGALEQESNNIVGILDTIKAIAEQTNLLALNAAIEAARAGEQGRGFAVVADEVRTLAGRTSESTDEIDKLLTRLQQQTHTVANKMEQSVSVANSSVELATQTYAVFEQILTSVLSIKDMMIQISASAEEQHLVAEEINNSVLVIHEGSTESNDLAEQVSQTATVLNDLSNELQSLVGRFKSSK